MEELVDLIFIGILLFWLLRNPCKKLKSYVVPLLGFSNGGNKRKKRKEKKRRKIPKIVATMFAAAKPPAQRPLGPIIVKIFPLMLMVCEH